MRRPTAFDTITTPRLTLRQPRPEDAADLAAGIGNYEVARWLGAVPFPYDEADARKFIEKTQDNPGQHWLVFDRDGLVGGTGIAGELGYWMARTAWGRGYASEAAEVAIDAHFTAPGATALKSGYFLGNVRSFRVLTKLGFRPGPIIERRSVTLRQTVEMQEMEMTHAEWQALRTYRLKTAHLTIRGVEPRDGRTLQRLLDLPHDIPFPVSQPQTQDEAARYAQWYRFRGRPMFMALICLPMGRAIGALMVAAGNGRVQLGHVLEPGYRAKGYGAEALGAFVRDMFGRFDLQQLDAQVPGAVPASALLLAPLGFRAEGASGAESPPRLEAGGNMHYRLTRSDWERAS